MMMLPWIADIYGKFAAPILSSHKGSVDVKQGRKCIDSLPRTQDCVELAYNKYRCRMRLFSPFQRFLMNAAAFFAGWIWLVYFLRSGPSIEQARKGCAILEVQPKVPFDDIVPESLYDEYTELVPVKRFDRNFGILCKEAKPYLFRCVKSHPFSFFFHFMVYSDLAIHSFYLLRYRPEATVIYVNERNMAGPVLTDLYEKNGRRLMLFMHGEMLWQPIQAYMNYSRHYVWDESYVRMYRDDLHCATKDYVVYTPRRLQKKWNLETVSPSYFCTYYFSGESEKSILKIEEVFRLFGERGLKCKVRPHPRNKWHLDLLTRTFHDAGIEIEDIDTVSIRDSLAQTEYAVGLNTTVLSEAYTEGRKVVIDDVSDPEIFHSLKARRYVMLSKEHLLLSDLIKRTAQNGPN